MTGFGFCRSTSGRVLSFVFVVLALIAFFIFGSRAPIPSRLTLPPSPPPSESTAVLGDIGTVDDQSKLAVVTYMNGDLEMYSQGSDKQFEATRALAYQLKRAPETKISDTRVDFVVLVDQRVHELMRAQLRKEGAYVFECQEVPLPPWIDTTVPHWIDQYNKLQILTWLQYDRVLYLDADMVLTGPVDPIFRELEVFSPLNTLSYIPGHPHAESSEEAQIPVQYLFAALLDNEYAGGLEYATHTSQCCSFNENLWVAAPSQVLYDYFLSVMTFPGRGESENMERSLLNYVFRVNGPMPVRPLRWKWAASWPSETDLKNTGVAPRDEVGDTNNGRGIMKRVWKGTFETFNDLYETTRRKE